MRGQKGETGSLMGGMFSGDYTVPYTTQDRENQHSSLALDSILKSLYSLSTSLSIHLKTPIELRPVDSTMMSNFEVDSF